MKYLFLLAICSILIVSFSCTSNNYPTNSGRNNFPKITNTEAEYNELIKTYKKETSEVLNSLLNDDSAYDETTITVTNSSPCNMVLTISGANGLLKKIPIDANGGIGYAMVKKNVQYKLSGMVCQSVYQSTKYISTHYSVSLSK